MSQNNIATELTADDIDPDWINKQKDMLQILWECGYIDE